MRANRWLAIAAVICLACPAFGQVAGDEPAEPPEPTQELAPAAPDQRAGAPPAEQAEAPVEILWQRQFGTSSADFATGIALDGDSNCYVAGNTQGRLGDDHLGESDVIIIKYDRNGEQQWSDWENLILFAGYQWDLFGCYYARNRYYHPTLGAWLTRDPIGYTDGMNLYEYTGSSPVIYTDPTGLWKYNRAGKPRAQVEAQKGDTIQDLADEIGLNAAEFQAWLTLTSPDILTTRWRRTLTTLNTTDVVCPGETVEIPNTVLAYWAGELGGFGKNWVMWHSDFETLEDRGFYVPTTTKTVRVRGPGRRRHTREITVEIAPSGWTAAQFEQYIQATSGQKELHGIFFWGHGYDKSPWSSGGVLTDASQSGNITYYSAFSSWNPAYELGLGVLFACHTQNGRGEFSSSPGVVFWGKTGVLVPHGCHRFGPSIDSLLPAGAQGTKK